MGDAIVVGGGAVETKDDVEGGEWLVGGVVGEEKSEGEDGWPLNVSAEGTEREGVGVGVVVVGVGWIGSLVCLEARPTDPPHLPLMPWIGCCTDISLICGFFWTSFEDREAL